MRLLSLLAGVVLLVALSIEIIGGDNRYFSRGYLTVQFVVCCVFLVDFFTLWAADTHKWRYFWRNLLFLLLSIPYLNIVDWMGIDLPRPWAMAVGITPLLRSFLALYMVVRWLIDGRMKKFFMAYILTVVVFTYLASLIFYDYEVFVNPHLHGFGNALWWAWMGVTTVGAAIFPVTAVGKTLAVLLPILGMMMFPIFTIYVTTVYTKNR